ncbi:MAG: Blue-light-activated protein [Acidobacteria bacterium]|nr:Blue-light-activated protein [Acidobacteriota bacterium]
MGAVLVVDDELELRTILCEALATQGFEVLGCPTGTQALAELEQKNFDILLTDLMMPEMDGIALLKSALEIDPHLVGIVMTGQGTIQTAVDAMQLGAFDYVLKPFRMQTLMPVLTRAMNTRRLHLENLQLRETLAIYGLSQTIAFTLDTQTVLSKLADAALQQSDADEVSILLPTNDGSELYVAAVRGARRERLLGERIPFDQSIASWVAREREPLILNGEVHDARFVALWPRPDIRSSISVPMQVANKLVGVINLNVTSRLRPFTLGQMKALTILAGTAAAALETASLYSQVRNAERNYRSIFENAVEGIFQSTPEGKFLSVNPSLARILGHESPAAVIATVTDIANLLYVDPMRRAAATDLLEEGLAVQGYEFEAYRADGTKIWLSENRRAIRDENGTVTYYEGTLEDITERKRIGEAEREIRQQYQALVNSIDGIVWELDANTFRFTFISDQSQRILGYAPDQWLAEPTFWADHLHSEDRLWAPDFCRRAIAKRESHQLDYRMVAADGRVVWLRDFVTIDAREATHVRLRGVMVDITERKQAEQALAESESRKDAILKSALDCVITVDHEGKVIDFNPSAEQTFGYSSSEVVGKLMVDLIIPVRTRPYHQAGFARYLATGTSTILGKRIEVAAMRADGSEIPIELTVTAIGELPYPTFTSFIRDLTERIRAEEGLRESEERYKGLTDSAFDGVVIHKDGVIMSTNRAYAEMFGYSIEELLGHDILELTSPEQRELVLSKFSGDDPLYEVVGLRKDGSLINIEVSQTICLYEGMPALLAAVRDITERILAESALRLSEERYRDLVENAHDIIYEHDLLGNYTSANKAGLEITGYSLEETRQLNIQQTVAPEYLEQAREMIRRKLEGQTVTAYEMEIVAKDGSRVAVEVNTRLVLQNGVPVGVQGIARDVTERKQLEEQLRQSQKLEAIGQLAGGVAHDFNNLLTVISGYSDLLLRRLPAESPFRSNVSEIKKAGDRASGLTRQLLAFSRKQILQPKVLDLNTVVSDLDKMLRRLIGEDVDLMTLTDPQLGQVKADPGQIEQVVVNLVVNARDAMTNGGGKVTIETSNATLTEDYAQQHAQCVPGAYVMLAVSDNGSGIDALVRDRIFEPFFSTKGAGKGTGLGLSTVYGIVKQSGGHIWVYSEIDKGTTFKIYLPRVDGGANGATDYEQKGVAPGGNETILLVEDEAQVRQIAQQILESLGYRVIAAENGEQALTIASEYPHNINLMVTDVVMPQMGGRELVDRLSPLRADLRVIFMSGYTDDAIVRHGLMDDRLEFIQKPFTADALARKVRATLDAAR